MDRIKVFKTTNTLSIALLIGFVAFNVKWLLWAALLLLLGAIIESRVTTILSEYWMKFAHILGNVNSRIILSIVFYMILTPFALIYRMFNKAAIDHFFGKNRKSNFDDKSSAYSKESLEKLW